MAKHQVLGVLPGRIGVGHPAQPLDHGDGADIGRIDIADQRGEPAGGEGPVAQGRGRLEGIAMALVPLIEQPTQLLFGKQRPTVNADLPDACSGFDQVDHQRAMAEQVPQRGIVAEQAPGREGVERPAHMDGAG